MAKKGQQPTVKVMCKDLVRVRGYVNKFIMMKTQLNAVSLKMQTMRSHQAMSQAMQGAYGCMKRMNQQFSLPALQQIMTDFTKENEKSEMHQEVMEDMIDDVMGVDDAEAEEDAVYSQVMDELGLDFGGLVPEAASSSPVPTAPVAAPAVAAMPAPVGGGGGAAGTGSGTSKDSTGDDKKKPGDDDAGGGGGEGGGGEASMDDLKERVARLQNLRR